jgi:hypothetical protein
MMETMHQGQISPLKPLPARIVQEPVGAAPRLMTAQADPPHAGKPGFRRFYGPAVVVLGLAFTAAWIVFVGYGLLSLMGLAI